MGVPAEQLVNELKALRKGLGVETDDIGARVGRALQRVCGVEDGDTGERVRRKVRDQLNALIDQCHPEQQNLLRAALGLDSAAPRMYQERIKEIAETAFVDPRTVQRRIDSALVRLTQLALETRRLVDVRKRPPWHTLDLRVVMSFDLRVPEVYETRRIVAGQDGVEEVEVGLTLTPPPDWTGSGSIEDLGVDLLYGGELSDGIMKARNRIGFVLRLPEPLARGDEHEYAFRVKVPVERGIAPHYVCTPRYQCDRFSLHVRFGAALRPQRVWRLTGVPPLELDDPVWTGDLVEPNRFGEVHTSFDDLEPQLSYGFGWGTDQP
ncbi:hypothetical protein [Lentzea sp. NEAU-D7]|uniref:hypothetical protein n=1 Tax=Lentzea sp. NEAU-D7 TaxID=2994667 RepID=UPI00224B72EF|nr:hypothetical protein [Lentzea sp. NEAU-D7]MCX2947382.1 hypothetical protein [Lentzea sp. NEAU-D7]